MWWNTECDGKTLPAQRVLEQYGYPYLSIDHLKRSRIRSGQCPLTPESDQEDLTAYLRPVVREIIRTALENGQNLTVEGCYIPFDYARDFLPDERNRIRYTCLVFSEPYIRTHYTDIVRHAGSVERREENPCAVEDLIRMNQETLKQCITYGCPYILTDHTWDPQIIL